MGITLKQINSSIFLMILSLTWGCSVSNAETPKYQTHMTDGSIEIRQYEPMIVAEVTMTGDRKQAINQGFKVLADYIFGNNITKSNIKMTAPVSQQSSKKIAMTAPVIQQQNSKIAMTAPVTQQGNKDSWTIRFMMPSQYTIDSLPKPQDKRITIKTIPAMKVAAIRFSGMSTQKNIQSHKKELRTYLSKHVIESISEPSYAFYNPPWTLPFLRRNEVMIQIK
jgi:effector-binding domain-containing protein